MKTNLLKPEQISRIRLLTNNPKKIIGLQGYGISVAGRVPLEVVPNENNIKYLSTKCAKMGHIMNCILPKES